MRGGVFPKEFDDQEHPINPRRKNFSLKEPDMAWVKVGVVTEDGRQDGQSRRAL